MPDVRLDAIDHALLNCLQDNARITNQQLSDQIGLSPSPCLRRLRNLEETGIISGYAALVDPEAIGLTTTAFVRVRLERQDDRHLEAFEAEIATIPEVMECYLMSGDADYQMRLLVRSIAAFEDLLRHRLTRIPGVAQVTTSFALRSVVYKTRLPL